MNKRLPAVIWVLPDGKGGTFQLPEKGRVPKPPDFVPWAAEWQFKGALQGHATWLIRWLNQEIDRLKAQNKRLQRRLTVTQG